MLLGPETLKPLILIWSAEEILSSTTAGSRQGKIGQYISKLLHAIDFFPRYGWEI
jgi:hypothetical protein